MHANSVTRPATDSPLAPVAWGGLLAILLTTLGVHLLAINQYGFFRDELYYLANTAHLGWGHVDHPPLCVWILAVATQLFGDGLPVMRSLAIGTGLGAIVMSALIARELGGAAWAQGLAALGVAVSPVNRVVGHLYSMNGWDVLLWAVVVWLWLRIGRTEGRALGLWSILGVVLGLALLNKLSALWLIMALVLATVATPRRSDFKAPGLYLATAISAFLFAPHVMWQVQNDFVTLEFIRNATTEKLLPVPPHQFVIVQAVVTNPLAVILWMTGLIMAWRRPEWRGLAIGFTAVALLLMVSMRSRENYLTPAYAFVLPVGALVVSDWLASRPALRTAYTAALGLTGLMMASLALPVLPVQTLASISRAAGFSPPASEAGKRNDIQGMADMFGWPEMAAAAAEVWQTLPEEERTRTPILGTNYGQSSAVWRFWPASAGPRPLILGRHNDWWRIGPQGWDGGTVVVIGETREDLRALFTEWREVRRMNTEWTVEEESTAPIAIARGLKVPVEEFWAAARLIR